MSLDSSRSYIHLHKPHHADLFEEFTTVPTSSSSNAYGSASAPTGTSTQPSALNNPLPGTSSAPIHNPQPLGNTPHPFMPSEDIQVPPRLLPPNPEDEDDVVPDQHAAFGITGAMSSAAGSRGLVSGAGTSGGGGVVSMGAGGAGGESVQRAKERWGQWRDFGSLLERVRGLELEGDNSGAGSSTHAGGAPLSRGAWLRGGGARGTRIAR